jgi:hypothetical protein
MENDEARGIDWQADEPATDVSSVEVTPLCMNCLQPTDPHTYYCPNCQSNDAVNPLVTYLPFEGLRFTYGGLAKVWGWLVPPDAPIWLKVVLTLGFAFAWPVTMPLLLIFWTVEPQRIRWYTLLTVFAVAALVGLGRIAFVFSRTLF